MRIIYTSRTTLFVHVLLLILCVFTGCPVWTNKPCDPELKDPTADCFEAEIVPAISGGDTGGIYTLARPELTAIFKAVNPTDIDSYTINYLDGSSSECMEETDIASELDSYWFIYDIGRSYLTPEELCGAPEITCDEHQAQFIFYGTTVIYGELQPWYWLNGDNIHGSVASTTGHFNFHDGRDNDDPRHDSKVIGSHTIHKLIPDTITTEYIGCERAYGGTGHVLYYMFKHHLYNHVYPAFSFEGMAVIEELVGVTCSNGPCPPQLLDNLNFEATGFWVVDGDNAFPECDKHGAGRTLSQALQDNDHVILFQVYKIINWGWPAPNPGHFIGRERGFSFAGRQRLVFWFEEREHGGVKLVVQKNGEGPEFYSLDCAENDLSSCEGYN